jgi:hypothetical protein
MKSFAVKFIKPLAVPAAALIVMAACSKNPESPSSQQQYGSVADRAAIEASIQQDDLFNSQGLDDDGEQSPDYDNGVSKVAEQINTIKFGRRAPYKLESIDVVFDSDTTATATITHSLNGKFLIFAKDTTNSNAVGTLYSKDMQNTILRKAKLRKVRDTGNDRRDWRVVAVSGAVASSPTTTITISELTYQNSDGTTLTITDPLAYFMSRDSGLPEFTRNDSVKIFVKLTNTNEFPPPPGETALLRYGMDHQSHRARKPLNDEGIYPDAVAGDGTYSGVYRVHGPRWAHRLHHAGVDIIDNGTIYDDVAPYNAVAWSLPYLVRVF